MDTQDNKNDHEWLMLAQKYRENGIGTTRDFSKQSNPGFLDDDMWEQYIKGKGDDFSNDKKISEALKNKCYESFKKPYNDDLSKQLKQWCRFWAPSDVKEIFNFQEENGGCRFWLISSAQHQTGWFVQEAIGLPQLKTLLADIKEEESKKEIVEYCKSNKDKILELIYWHPDAEQKQKKVYSPYSKWKETFKNFKNTGWIHESFKHIRA